MVSRAAAQHEAPTERRSVIDRVWDWIWPLLAAPFVGSVLGVLIRRLPQGRPVAIARSACESCGTVLAPRDLVPLVSHLLLRGRCRRCAAPIAAGHWQVELAAVAVAAAVVLAGVGPDRLWLDCGFGWVLLALAWIDWDTMTLPDVLTLPLVLAGLCTTWWLDGEATSEHAAASALGYAAFRLVGALYHRLRGREGLGQGDAKLLAALGAWTGLEGLPYVVLGGALAGLGLAAVLSSRGRVGATTPIPFGPCLALAGFVVRLHT